MRRINYKSDIPPLLLSLKVDEKQITVPDCDFIVRFYIDGYEGRHYDCSHIGGVWSNCEPSEDGTKLVCYINNQRLGIGELCAEFHYISPDNRYSDGSKKSVVIIGSTELGVELVEDNGDAVTEAAIDVTLPFIYRTAYEIARDHGYTGTAEDFYSALASVVGIADAEKKRVTAEITRNANEQERIENEENRLNAENERVNAEAQRVRNEAIRGDAESTRVEQEEDRKAKFEEITGFIATVRANEGNRESNERERQTNEDTRITEEAKRVEAEKKRAAEFEKQKLDLAGKIDRSGDEMGGDLIFTDNAGVSFQTSDGGAHTMFNDTDDVAKFTANNGDTFEFAQNETPNKNSSAVVVSKNLYNALDMTLESMGSALDGDAAYRADAGDKIFNPDTCKIQRYNSTIGGFEDLCDPIDGKLYANKMTGYIYRWDTKTKKMVFVGGVKAYTKDEADRRFAKLDDATQRVKVKELNAYNSINTNSMWIGDEGLLLGGDGNGHLTVEQDQVITDVTLNEKLSTKADDLAYMVDFNNPDNIEKTGTVKEATQSLVIAAGLLLVGGEQVKEELNSKIDKELHVVLASMGATLDNVDGGDGPTVDAELKIGDFFFDEGKKSIIYKKSETETLDLGEPNDKKIYANAITKRLYIWRGGTWRQCGTDAYTKAESDNRYYDKHATDTLLDEKVGKSDIVQSTGTSTTAVMSQKSVSDALSNVYTKAESDARYLRGEVLYEDYYYPNMSPTTDTTRFSDSTEILQPTKFIESYTDADGTTWSNVFECESFPDWFDFAERKCYPYGNGYSTGYLFLRNFAVENNGLVYDFDRLQNNNIGKKLPYHGDNGLGLKKIDATHFKVYNSKNNTTEFTSFDKANVDCSLFAFSPLTYNQIYDIDDCKLLRITLTGNIKSPSRYDSLLDGSCDVGLLGYNNMQVLYGDEYVEIEIDKNNNRWRQVKSGYSMFCRSSHLQNWSANKPESYESECHCLWSNIHNGTVQKICMINNKVCYSFIHWSNPSTILKMGCKIKIEKLA